MGTADRVQARRALPLPTAILSCRFPYNQRVSSDSVKQMASADFPTRWGRFRIYGFRLLGEDAVALVMGDVHSSPPLVRIHSQCLTGDVFGSLRCDCRQQLEMALSLIAQEGAG